MALQIIWSENALEDYQHIVEYLLKEWTINVASGFVETVEARVKNLSIFPFVGIASGKEPGVRSIVITKQNLLYYKISASRVEILNIFDTRQDPDKNKYK